LIPSVLACGRGEDRKPAAPPLPAAGKPAVERLRGRGPVCTEMAGVDLRIDPEVVLEVRSLRGTLQPTREGEPPWFDDPESFAVQVDSAEIAVTPASLAAIMNRYLFAGPKAPVKDVEIEIRDGKLVQSSTLQKKIPIHTTLEGSAAATPEGDLLFHPEKIKAGDLPVKGLLDLLDIELSEMIKSQESRGLRIVDNDLILDPERLLPSPRFKGRVTAVRIEPDRIVQIFGAPSAGRDLSPPFKAAHYMFYRGGELSFGKVTMHNADLQIIDADPRDPFNFFLARYNEQLVAGFSRTLTDRGLVVFMPDFDERETGRLVP
jgi:hypothetical protein